MTTSSKSAPGGTVCGNTARNRSTEPLDSPNASGPAIASDFPEITRYDHAELERLVSRFRGVCTLSEAGASWVNENRGCAFSSDELIVLFDTIRDAGEQAYGGISNYLDELQGAAVALQESAPSQIAAQLAKASAPAPDPCRGQASAEHASRDQATGNERGVVELWEIEDIELSLTRTRVLGQAAQIYVNGMQNIAPNRRAELLSLLEMLEEQQHGTAEKLAAVARGLLASTQREESNHA